MKPQQSPDLGLHLKFEGFYRCVLNEGTDDEVDTGWFPNLVTDLGLDRLGNTAVTNLFQWGSIGTGTTAPANSNTSLQAYVASTSTSSIDSQSNVGASTYAAQMQIHHTYAQGAVVGNMAEVGVGWASGGGSLWSRALILDSGGSPTTLTVTSLDQLTVYYKLVATPAITDATGSVTLSGTAYGYTGRIANSASWLSSLDTILTGTFGQWGTPSPASSVATYPSTSALGAITTVPSGASSTGSTVATGAYTNGNFYLDSTITLSPSQGNSAGGIGAMTIPYSGGSAAYQYSFGTAIPKDNTKTMTLVVRFSWGR